MKKVYCLIPALALTVVMPLQVSAQFFKVYEYTTPDAGEIEVVYWTTYVPSSGQDYSFFGKNYSREGLFAQSIEVEYGLSTNLTVSAYMDFEMPDGSDMRKTKTKAVLARYSMYEKGSRPVDIALYLEYILPCEGYKDSEEIEFKLILEKDIRNLRLTLNPTFEKKVSGEVEEGMEFSFSGGIYCARNLDFQPGIEFYTKMGELRETKGFDEQSAYIFPTLDWRLHRHFVWHVGAGFGLSDNSDDTVLKSILSFEY